MSHSTLLATVTTNLLLCLPIYTMQQPPVLKLSAMQAPARPVPLLQHQRTSSAPCPLAWLKKSTPQAKADLIKMSATNITKKRFERTEQLYKTVYFATPYSFIIKNGVRDSHTYCPSAREICMCLYRARSITFDDLSITKPIAIPMSIIQNEYAWHEVPCAQFSISSAKLFPPHKPGWSISAEDSQSIEQKKFAW